MTSATPLPAATMAEDAFRAVCRTHSAQLLSYVRRLTFGDDQQAQDVVQETLLRAWRESAKAGVDATSIRPWLFTVARNLVFDLRRARRRRPAEVSLAALPDRGSSSDRVGSSDRAGSSDTMDRLLTAYVVRRGLDALSPEHRSVLVQLYVQQQTVSEAATVLRVPVGTVKSRAYYALRALRRSLDGAGVTAAVAAG